MIFRVTEPGLKASYIVTQTVLEEVWKRPRLKAMLKMEQHSPAPSPSSRTAGRALRVENSRLPPRGGLAPVHQPGSGRRPGYHGS